MSKSRVFFPSSSEKEIELRNQVILLKRLLSPNDSLHLKRDGLPLIHHIITFLYSNITNQSNESNQDTWMLCATALQKLATHFHQAGNFEASLISIWRSMIIEAHVLGAPSCATALTCTTILLKFNLISEVCFLLSSMIKYISDSQNYSLYILVLYNYSIALFSWKDSVHYAEGKTILLQAREIALTHFSSSDSIYQLIIEKLETMYGIKSKRTKSNSLNKSAIRIPKKNNRSSVKSLYKGDTCVLFTELNILYTKLPWLVTSFSSQDVINQIQEMFSRSKISASEFSQDSELKFPSISNPILGRTRGNSEGRSSRPSIIDGSTETSLHYKGDDFMLNRNTVLPPPFSFSARQSTPSLSGADALHSYSRPKLPSPSLPILSSQGPHIRGSKRSSKTKLRHILRDLFVQQSPPQNSVDKSSEKEHSLSLFTSEIVSSIRNKSLPHINTADNNKDVLSTSYHSPILAFTAMSPTVSSKSYTSIQAIDSSPSFVNELVPSTQFSEIIQPASSPVINIEEATFPGSDFYANSEKSEEGEKKRIVSLLKLLNPSPNPTDLPQPRFLRFLRDDDTNFIPTLLLEAKTIDENDAISMDRALHGKEKSTDDIDVCDSIYPKDNTVTALKDSSDGKNPPFISVFGKSRQEIDKEEKLSHEKHEEEVYRVYCKNREVKLKERNDRQEKIEALLLKVNTRAAIKIQRFWRSWWGAWGKHLQEERLARQECLPLRPLMTFSPVNSTKHETLKQMRLNRVMRLFIKKWLDHTAFSREIAKIRKAQALSWDEIPRKFRMSIRSARILQRWWRLCFAKQKIQQMKLSRKAFSGFLRLGERYHFLTVRLQKVYRGHLARCQFMHMKEERDAEIKKKEDLQLEILFQNYKREVNNKLMIMKQNRAAHRIQIAWSTRQASVAKAYNQLRAEMDHTSLTENSESSHIAIIVEPSSDTNIDALDKLITVDSSDAFLQPVPNSPSDQASTRSIHYVKACRDREPLVYAMQCKEHEDIYINVVLKEAIENEAKKKKLLMILPQDIRLRRAGQDNLRDNELLALCRERAAKKIQQSWMQVRRRADYPINRALYAKSIAERKSARKKKEISQIMSQSLFEKNHVIKVTRWRKALLDEVKSLRTNEPILSCDEIRSIDERLRDEHQLREIEELLHARKRDDELSLRPPNVTAGFKSALQFVL